MKQKKKFFSLKAIRLRNCFDFSRKDAESVHVQQTAVSVGPAVGVTMSYHPPKADVFPDHSHFET